MTPDSSLRRAVEKEKPLQCVGAINAYHSLLAESAGFKAVYLSGGGVSAGSCGLPDLGITTMDDVLTDLRRITAVSDLPVLVDIDTGWGGAFNITRTVKAMSRAGAAAIHIEDQIQQKRCGQRPNKKIVSQQEMVDRIKAAVDARSDDDFVIMARTDAIASEGLNASMDRAEAYVQAGADMIFPEAIENLEHYRKFTTSVRVPVLANITEFGVSPLFTIEQLRSAGVSIALYPLSAFRAANAAALRVYQTIRKKGTQQSMVESMQTREQLYQFLKYHSFEQNLDKLFEDQTLEDL